MVPFDDIGRLLIETIFASDTSTDLWVCPLDIVIHRFPDIMEESSLERQNWISTNKFGNSFSDIGDFFTMHEDILSIARTKSEFADKWDNLIGNTDDPHLVDGFLTEITDELIRILLVFLDNLLDTSWLDSLISDEIFERLLGDIATK
jgi:hypothetical protein